MESIVAGVAGLVTWLYANALAPAASAVFLGFLAPRAPLVALTAAGAGFAWWRLRPTFDEVKDGISVWIGVAVVAGAQGLALRVAADEAGRPVELAAELIAVAVFILAVARWRRDLWQGRVRYDRLPDALRGSAAVGAFFLLLSLSIRWVYTLP